MRVALLIPFQTLTAATRWQRTGMGTPSTDRPARPAHLQADDLLDDADGSEHECLLPPECPQVL